MILFEFQKVLSNSEDLKIKNWLIEETNNEETEEGNIINHNNNVNLLDQVFILLENFVHFFFFLDF